MLVLVLCQAAGKNPTREQCRRMDGAFLAIGALNDVLKATVREMRLLNS